MIPVFVALASSLVLCAAQLHVQPQQQVRFIQNLEAPPLSSLPNSQSLMTHTAHSILGQGHGAPLQPGILGGLPVLVSEAAQNVLDQESKIVGYNVSPELSAQILQQQQQEQQQVQVQSSSAEGQQKVQQTQVIGAAPQTQLIYQAQEHPQIHTLVRNPGQQNLEEEQPQVQQAQLVATSPHLLHAYEPPPSQQILQSSGETTAQNQDQSQVQQHQENNETPAVATQVIYRQIPAVASSDTTSEVPGHQQIQNLPTENAASTPQILYQQVPVDSSNVGNLILPQDQEGQTTAASFPFSYHTLSHQFPPAHTPQFEPQPQIQFQQFQPQLPLFQYLPNQQVSAVGQQLNEVQPQGEVHQHLQFINPDVPPQQLLLQTPQIIPITQADAIQGRERRPQPQSIEIPLINGRPRNEVSFRFSQNQFQSDNKQLSKPSSQSYQSKSRDQPPSRPSHIEISRIPLRQVNQNTRENENIAYMRPPQPYLRDSSERQRYENNDGYSNSNAQRQNNYGRPPPPDRFPSQGENQQNRPFVTTTTPSPFDFPPQNDDAIEIPALRSENGRDRPRGPQSLSLGSFVRTPQFNQDNDRPTGYNDNGNGFNLPSENPESRVHKHIFVHAAPEPQKESKVRVIRPKMNQEKHVNIIFVRSPQPEREAETVVELPPMEQPRTLVYVLSKKPEENSEIKVVQAPTPKPAAPEIYFVRYGDKGTGDVPVANLQSLLDGSNQANTANFPVSLGNQNQGFYQVKNSSLRFKRDKDYGIDMYAPLMSYRTSGQVNEVTQEEAEMRRNDLNDFF